MTPAPGLRFFAVELSHQRSSEILPISILPPTDAGVRVTDATRIEGAPSEELTHFCGIKEGPPADEEIVIGGERYIVWGTDFIGGTKQLFFAQLWREFEKTPSAA